MAVDECWCLAGGSLLGGYTVLVLNIELGVLVFELWECCFSFFLIELGNFADLSIEDTC